MAVIPCIPVHDGALYSEAATVTITVNPINDAPVADDDQDDRTDEETPLDGTVTATDVEGDSLTYSGTGDTPYGAVVVNTGSVHLYPDADLLGRGRLHVHSQRWLLTDTGVVTITVNPVNDAPVPRRLRMWSGWRREAHTYEVPPFDPDGDGRFDLYRRTVRWCSAAFVAGF